MDYLSTLAMVTFERAKELLSNNDLTDQQIEEIRDAFKSMAEIIYEKWLLDKPLIKQIYESEQKPKSCT